MTLICNGMLQQGSVDIDIALSLNANYPDALLLKGKCIYVSGDFDNAMKYYKKLKDLKPNEAFTHFHIANLLMLNGDFETAVNSYKNSSIIQNTASSHYQLAKCLVLLEKPQEAIKELETAVKLNNIPTYRYDLDSLKIFQKITSFDKAEAFFTEMLHKNRQKEIDQDICFKGDNNTDFCRSDMEGMYKFPIFEIEDWTAYRAIMRLFLGKYTES